MTTIKTISSAMARAAAAFALSLSTAAPVGAADFFKAPPAGGFGWSAPTVPASYVGEVGGRMWFGRARTSKNLFDTTGTAMVSRLDYFDMSIYSGEAFGRVDGNTGWFMKGYAGMGGLFDGKLKDEDFPPFIDPYSATMSNHLSSVFALYYGSIDGGFKLVRGPDFHLGAFVGYHFMGDRLRARGCTQLATNPLICGGGGVPNFVTVISQDNDWHSFRVGLEAAVEIDRVRFTVDAAYLPYVALYGADTHHLRIGTDPGSFTGPIPEDGKGWGYQIDVTANWRVNEWLTVGGGGRYWYAQAKGHTHFEGRVVDVNAQPQPVHWKAEHFGGFLQATVKFGPHRLIASN